MADTDDDGFIGMPPGIFDSGTFKLPPKTERPRVEREEIVFVPTVLGMPVAERDEVAPEQPAQQEPQAEQHATHAAAAAWRLTLDGGAETIVTGVLLVGRNPAPFEAYPGADLLAIEDTTQSVSKTHAAFEVDDSGLWVHDLNSTNGVWVVQGDGVTEVAPGRRVHVPNGSSIELGDYVLTARRG